VYLAARTRGRTLALVLAGLVLGLTTLVRPQSLLCAPAMGIFVWLELQGAAWPRRATRTLAAMAIATAACLAVVAPWTARNCAVMDGCALVSTNGGWNLAIGASPRATGRFEALHPSDGCREVTGQVQQDRCWQAVGVAWIARDPARWLALIPAKLAHTFDHQSFAVGYLAEADPTAWPESRRASWREVLTASSRALLVLAALGMVALPRSLSSLRGPARAWLPRSIALVGVLGLAVLAAVPEQGAAWPLALAIPLLATLAARVGPPAPAADASALALYLAFVVASTCVIHAVFFGEDRYQIVVVPALVLLAARALQRTW